MEKKSHFIKMDSATGMLRMDVAQVPAHWDWQSMPSVSVGSKIFSFVLSMSSRLLCRSDHRERLTVSFCHRDTQKHSLYI